MSRIDYGQRIGGGLRSGSALPRFSIDVDQGALNDLRAQLKVARDACVLEGEDQWYGVDAGYLGSLVDYWADEFDWRAVEKEFNTFVHHRVDVNGTPVHFIREPGRGPAPIPLLLLHGWPQTFWDWSKVIRPLADPGAHGADPSDAFEVIVASLPGFAYSTPLTNGEENYVNMADRFHTLMSDLLGFRRYAIGAGDYGTLVGAQIGHKYTDSLYGLHLGNELPTSVVHGGQYWDAAAGKMVTTGFTIELQSDVVNFRNTDAPHVKVHMLDVQTLAHGLTDSPVGILAWMLKRWRTSYCPEQGLPIEHILTNATIYWVNQAVSSSVRAYRNANLYPWVPSHDRRPPVEAPAGFTLLLGETARSDCRTREQRIAEFQSVSSLIYADVRGVNVHEDGGNAGPWQNPSAWINDLRSTFRQLR